jgi:hypothetical protein
MAALVGILLILSLILSRVWVVVIIVGFPIIIIAMVAVLVLVTSWLLHGRNLERTALFWLVTVGIALVITMLSFIL